MDYAELSKEISYILRHNPQGYGLTLNNEGWVDLAALIFSLRMQEQYKHLEASDIESIVFQPNKRRHEIHNGRIRALYGHTLQEKIEKEPAQPPEILFHGTSKKSAENIMKEGLLSQSRQYVHLSQDRETANRVGKRKDKSPVIFAIDAKKAWSAGILFYPGNENIWLSDSIPPEFIGKD
jgi:putative RNA 2'-phosphotransferase